MNTSLNSRAAMAVGLVGAVIGGITNAKEMIDASSPVVLWFLIQAFYFAGFAITFSFAAKALAFIRTY